MSRVSVTTTRDGTCTSAQFPNFIFASESLLREHSAECLRYETAVAAYAKAIKPATVGKVVRAARKCGHDVITPHVVKDLAATDLREALLALPGYDERDVEWHLANPGKTMKQGFA